MPDASNLRVSELREPQSSGFSNDTLLFELEYERANAAECEFWFQNEAGRIRDANRLFWYGYLGVQIG